MTAGRSLAVAALVGVALTGCAGRAHTAPPISQADLQSSLAGELAAGGTPAQSVSCPRDLQGAVGSTARCEVAFNDTDAVTALLTTLGSENGTASYEITRAELTREQLAKRVAAMSGAASATCEFGLDGQAGDFSQCDVNRNGLAYPVTAEVKSVKGLVIDLSVTQVMPRQAVEDALSARLTSLLGQRPDSVNCPEALVGNPGTTMDCVVTVGDKPQTYVLTVTGAGAGTVDFFYLPKVAS